MAKRGFTLIEMMIVMAVVAVLALLVIGAITAARRTALVTANRDNARTLQTGLEAFYARKKAFCPINSGGTPTVSCGGIATFLDLEKALRAEGVLGLKGLAGGYSGANGGGTLTFIAIDRYRLDYANWEGLIGPQGAGAISNY